MNEELDERQSKRFREMSEDPTIDLAIRNEEKECSSANGEKLNKLDAQLKELERERERILGACEDRFEADMEEIREKWANDVLFPRSMVFTREAAEAGVAMLEDGLRSMKTELKILDTMIHARSNPQNPKELKELLRHARNCHSSDPRDRVYAFLGLAHQQYGIVPNYSWANDAVKVFVDTCKKIIEFDCDLSILEHAALARKDLGCFLPSWVPDWTSRVDYDFRLECARVADIKTDSSPNFVPPRIKSLRPEYRADEDGNVGRLELKVEGVLVDVIDSFSDSALEPSHVQSLKATSGHDVFTGRQAQLGDEIWVIPGASWPIVLRPEGDSKYIFLGEALICEKDVPLVADVLYSLFKTNEVDKEKTVTKDIYLV
jgi:hypothetical protein